MPFPTVHRKIPVFVFLMKEKPQTQELPSVYPEQPLEIQKTVYEKSGVILETEIKKIGEFGEEN